MKFLGTTALLALMTLTFGLSAHATSTGYMQASSYMQASKKGGSKVQKREIASKKSKKHKNKKKKHRH